MSILSVGVPVYNGEKYLKKTIESVLNQTLKDIDIYVFDNCSTDNTEQGVQEFLASSNFHYVRRPENMGVRVNWNSCFFETGDSKYVAMLHADDQITPNHAEKMIGMLEQHENCALSYNPCVWVDKDDKFIQLMNHGGHPKLPSWGGRNEFAYLLVYDCFITMSSAIFRRDIINKVGEFGFDRSGDWVYFLKIASINSNFCFDPEPTTSYRYHEEQQSRDYYTGNDPLLAHVTLLQDALQHYNGKEKLVGYENRIWSLLNNRIAQYPEGAFGQAFMIQKIGEWLQRMVEENK